MNAIATTPRRRRTRFYFEIHLRDGYVVSKTDLFSGMLEAEREVDRLAAEISEKVKKPQRGYLIMRAALRNS